MVTVNWCSPSSNSQHRISQIPWDLFGLVLSRTTQRFKVAYKFRFYPLTEIYTIFCVLLVISSLLNPFFFFLLRWILLVCERVGISDTNKCTRKSNECIFCIITIRMMNFSIHLFFVCIAHTLSVCLFMRICLNKPPRTEE